ncbi:DUF218 domain-containing protein [Chitinophaga niastensis]|uniref:DUF218 domain-containing protein n=1 Tax=Chitinophaga niastensis TaxID=536980 RepID=A0A2P8HH00_CHINA|nr:YdcF family protein [Chitinophaga niastensis]PSL45498.1 DUF218 domain-containing protein [Chitinophaga niastensis]
MHYLKNYLLSLFLLFIFLPSAKSQSAYLDPSYNFLTSTSFIQDKNFYFFTLLEKMPAVNRLLAKDANMQRLFKTYRQRIAHPVTNGDVSTRTSPFLFSEEMINQVGNDLPRMLLRYPQQMDELVKTMRSSGLFQLYIGTKDEVLLSRAWEDAANGVNYIINAYTTNKGLRYPTIDSAAYYVKSPAYQAAVGQLLKTLSGKDNNTSLFFQPSLDLAMGLLLINKRDEAGRYEPLSDTNREAYTYLKTIDWDRYTYTTMLILGASPGGKETISEAGKNRCHLGAEMFRKGMAPCIIVSGGHVRPVGTPYSEAIEMKKYLVNELKIPAVAVMVDPYARHTTTNIRNAVRMAYRNGIPVKRRMMCVSDAMHLNYVTSRMFELRCLKELGYVPAADIKQADLYFITFTPDIRSLQADARDPLDP